jgi:hypothetical protein
MELDIVGSKLINGYGEEVDIEEDLIYPLLKSSDIANEKTEIRKKVLVTQKQVGEGTGYIKDKYPKTWKYLYNHIEDFEKRKSCIYKNKPLFSMFSIGDYCFYPYKIAISGLYKNLNFMMVIRLTGNLYWLMTLVTLYHVIRNPRLQFSTLYWQMKRRKFS